MQPLAEVILAVLPGAQDDEQVEIVLCQLAGEGSIVELRQQTWGEGVGWFTQSRVRMAPQQIADLRAVLGTGAARPKQNDLPRAFSRATPGAFTPRVVHADSA
jgi:hypothetical protein